MVLGRRASTRVVVHPPTHPVQAAEPQELALGPWPLRLNQGRRPSPNPPAGIKGVCRRAQGGGGLPLRVSGSTTRLPS